jgi:hypothetical protein
MLMFKIILAAVVYIMIGGFICGFVDEKKDRGLLIAIWPLVIIGTVIFIIAEIPRQVGERISDLLSK